MTLQRSGHQPGPGPSERLLSTLGEIVGARNVLASQDDREDYAFDAFSPERARLAAPQGTPLPIAAVRPGSAHEVREVLLLAAREGVPVVPYGGGTGVMGAAVPLRPAIMLDLRRMDRVLEISPGGMMARVEAGILLGKLNETLESQGLMLGHDPWSRAIATVGGAISTNGVGYLAGRYGSMGEQVLGLSVVLANGEVIPARTVSKLAGPDLASLFIGAEGTLGVITEATLRVFPLPQHRVVRVLAFQEFASGYAALAELGRMGVRPSMIDFGEEPFEDPPNTFLRLAFEGFDDDVWVQERAALEVCGKHGGRGLGPEAAREFWEMRHASAEAWAERNARGRRLGRGWGRRGNRWFDYIHVALAPERVLDYKARCARLIDQAGMQVREWGIWGRLDLFSMAIVGPEGGENGDASAPSPGSELSRKLIALANEMGGSMEYCHGVGLKLLPYVPMEMGGGLEVLRAIKRALDPQGVLNPGKLGLP